MKMVPRPDTAVGTNRSERQEGQIGLGGWCQVPHLAQRLISSWLLNRPR